MSLKRAFLFPLTVFVLLIILFTAVGYLFVRHDAPDYVVVNNQKLFEGFNMSKEMKRVGEREFQYRKASLDSLYRNLQEPALAAEEKKILLEEFTARKDELDQFSQSFASEESAKIWSRIESYTLDFSKENHYSLILGSENKRNVLYASEERDITAALLNYINKKYEGHK